MRHSDRQHIRPGQRKPVESCKRYRHRLRLDSTMKKPGLHGRERVVRLGQYDSLIIVCLVVDFDKRRFYTVCNIQIPVLWSGKGDSQDLFTRCRGSLQHGTCDLLPGNEQFVVICPFPLLASGSEHQCHDRSRQFQYIGIHHVLIVERRIENSYCSTAHGVVHIIAIIVPLYLIYSDP